MKKLLIITSCILTLLSLFVFIPIIRANRLATLRPTVHQSVTVIIDAGHGGKDGGASSRSGVVERDLVFNISKMVEEQLQLSGFHVILTRKDGCDLASEYAKNRKREDLACRVNILNTTPNAIAVSIHANAIDNQKWSGAQVFYDAKMLENKELSAHIMDALRQNIPHLTREHRPISNIYILRHAIIPTALVEVGFLSNPSEANLLATKDYQQQLAYAIFEGILAYVEAIAVVEETVVPTENE